MARGNIDYDQIRAAARRGDGSLIQMGDGGYTPGNVLVYDANGNAVDGGSGTAGGGIPGSLSATIDLIPASPDAMDDEFIANSLDPKWTYVNPSSGNFVFGYGRMATDLASDLGAITQPHPGAPCEFLMKFSSELGAPAGNPWIGLGFTDGTKYQVLVYGYINGNFRFEVENMSAYNTYSSSPATQVVAGYRSGEWFIKVKDDGTNLIFYYSVIGTIFNAVYTVSRTAFLGSPTDLAIHWSAGSAMSIDFFRRLS